MKTKPIPVGAIKIPLRDVEQPDEFSCGAASLMAICSYYNVGSDYIEAFKQSLRTDPDDGAYYDSIAQYARKLNLVADIYTPMSVKAVKKHLAAGRPVICSIQAYSDDDHPDYRTDGNGHYVVAIGYDEKTVYFMDPSANYDSTRGNPCYAYLSVKAMKRRWHEDEGVGGKHERLRRLGIVIYPKASPLLEAREIE
jgi:hypothetical protein